MSRAETRYEQRAKCIGYVPENADIDGIVWLDEPHPGTFLGFDGFQPDDRAALHAATPRARRWIIVPASATVRFDDGHTL